MGYCNINGYLYQYSSGTSNALPGSVNAVIPAKEEPMSTLEDKQTELLVTIDELKQQALDIGKQIEAEKEKSHEWKVGDCFETDDGVRRMIIRVGHEYTGIYPSGHQGPKLKDSVEDVVSRYYAWHPVIITLEEWCNGRS